MARSTISEDTYFYDTREYHKWSQWLLYLQPKHMEAIAKSLSESIARTFRKSSLFALCPIPTSGLMLTGLLHSRISKAFPDIVVVGYDWRATKFHEQEAVIQFENKRDKRQMTPPQVLLIDTVMNTGTSFYLARQMVEQVLGWKVAGLCVVLFNDDVPPDLCDREKNKSPEEMELWKSGTHFIYCETLTALKGIVDAP